MQQYHYFELAIMNTNIDMIHDFSSERGAETINIFCILIIVESKYKVILFAVKNSKSGIKLHF